MPAPDIILYCNSDPNSLKTKILLEELGVPYKVQVIDITINEQKEESVLIYTIATPHSNLIVLMAHLPLGGSRNSIPTDVFQPSWMVNIAFSRAAPLCCI
jgi:hypothetical protein